MISIPDRIRRNTDGRIFLLQAWAVFYSFAAAASRTDSPSSMLADPWAFLRMAIPAVAVLVVLLLRNGYADPEKRTPTAAVVDVGISLAFAILSEQVLAAFAPSLALPRSRATQGFAVAWFFLTALRAGFPPRSKVLADPETSLRIEEVRWQAEESARQMRQWSIRGYLAASVVLVFFALAFVLTNAPRVRAASGFIITGALYSLWQLHKSGWPDVIPADADFNMYRDFRSRVLESQRTLLQRVWYWYLGAIIPAVLLLLIGSQFYGYFVLMYVFLIAELMHRAIRRRQLN